MQAEFQCSYSLQLLLGNQQQILTPHFHVSPFAFPLGRALVLLHLATTTDSNLAYITGSPRSKKKKREESRERARRERARGESPREKVAHPKNTETVAIVEICALCTPRTLRRSWETFETGARTLSRSRETFEYQENEH